MISIGFWHARYCHPLHPSVSLWGRNLLSGGILSQNTYFGGLSNVSEGSPHSASRWGGPVFRHPGSAVCAWVWCGGRKRWYSTASASRLKTLLGSTARNWTEGILEDGRKQNNRVLSQIHSFLGKYTLVSSFNVSMNAKKIVIPRPKKVMSTKTGLEPLLWARS